MAGILQTLQSPPVDEYMSNPDFRTIAAFFLGWVFIASLDSLLHSTSFRTVFTHMHTQTTKQEHRNKSLSTLEKQISTENASLSSSLFSKRSNGLIFLLSFCFLCASIALFITTLTFTDNAAIACSFNVAFGGLASYCARLVGLIILVVQLHRFGIRRWELITMSCALVGGMVLVFTNEALVVGSPQLVVALNVSVCYRNRFAPLGLSTGIVFMMMEIGAVIRLASFVIPSSRVQRHLVPRVASALGNHHVLKALSLVLLELLTFIPASLWINVLSDYVPFCVGALVVLIAFNSDGPESDSPSIDMSSVDFDSDQFVRQPRMSYVTQAQFRRSRPVTMNHPFSAVYSAQNADIPNLAPWWENREVVLSPRGIDNVDLLPPRAPTSQDIPEDIRLSSSSFQQTGSEVILHHPRPTRVQGSKDLPPLSESPVQNKILKNQVDYAKQYLGTDMVVPQSLTVRPRIKVTTEFQQFVPTPSSRDSVQFPHSAFHGKPPTLQRTHTGRTFGGDNESTFESSIAPPMPSSRRYSFASGTTHQPRWAGDQTPVVTNGDNQRVVDGRGSRTRPPTLAEHQFRSLYAHAGGQRPHPPNPTGPRPLVLRPHAPVE